ncbi:hypothetical protein [Streptomyces sp. NPDC051286]|uniref:hypothetical protein n=1 Tax=Streptomyces sp. NPDC051286 TaxID=3365647 RepID=UPI0037B10ED2
MNLQDQALDPIAPRRGRDAELVGQVAVRAPTISLEDRDSAAGPALETGGSASGVAVIVLRLAFDPTSAHIFSQDADVDLVDSPVHRPQAVGKDGRGQPELAFVDQVEGVRLRTGRMIP